jgi:hypothetical protein
VKLVRRHRQHHAPLEDPGELRRVGEAVPAGVSRSARSPGRGRCPRPRRRAPGPRGRPARPRRRTGASSGSTR